MDEMPDLQVVGRHRATHRFVTMILDGSWLENFRADLVYSPEVIRLLGPRFDGSPASKRDAEKDAESYTRLRKPTSDESC
jgi:hypothetical protein